MNRPNIFIFMPDQLRADCLGCFGNPVVQTPNIDQLAARGARFDNAWVNHPVCGPSRVNLMTGWYPHTRGHRTLTHLVQPHEPNLLRYLKDGGYHVAWAGARGDVFAPGVTELSTHFCGWTTRPDRKQMGMGPQFPDGSALYNAFYHGKRPGETTWLDFDEASIQTALDWLDASPDGPWCLWIPLIFPHLPFEVEDPWYSLHHPDDMPPRIKPSASHGKPLFHQAIRDTLGTGRLTEEQWREISRVYYGMISRLDTQLGQVMDRVTSTGMMDNTVTLFFTDHGEYLGDFDLVEKWPSGLDRSLTQNPLIIAGPDIGAGTRHTFAEMVDILPTLLELAGIEARHTHFGRSLVPALSSADAEIRDCAFTEGGFGLNETDLLERPEGEYARKGQLQHDQPRVVGRAICLRCEDYTYVYRLYEDDELYARRMDPNETTNRIHDADFAATAADMKARVMDWLLETADVIPWDADPRFPKTPQGQHQNFGQN